jgi:putative transposase
MPNYRRAFVPGGTFYLTLVTAGRMPFLCDDLARPLLRAAIEQCRARWPFAIDCFVLMPDHLHWIWTLPEDDTAYSARVAWIKRTFTAGWTAAGGAERAVTAAQHGGRRRGVWQPRFWEHVVRSPEDRNRLFDYVHFNPVKHGYVKCPKDWPYSSFHRFVREGFYERDWGCVEGGAPPTWEDIEDILGE